MVIVIKETSKFGFHLSFLPPPLPFYLLIHSYHASHSSSNTPFFSCVYALYILVQSLDIFSLHDKFQLILQISNPLWNLLIWKIIPSPMLTRALHFLNPELLHFSSCIISMYDFCFPNIMLSYCTDVWNHYTKQNTAFCF